MRLGDICGEPNSMIEVNGQNVFKAYKTHQTHFPKSKIKIRLQTITKAYKSLRNASK